MLSLLNTISGGYIALIVIGGVLLLSLIALFVIVPMKAWFTALFSKAHVSMARLISLRWRKINVMAVLENYIMARNAKLDLKFTDIEAFYLTGADIKRALSALIFAKSANMNVNFDMIKALELAGQDSVEVLNSYANPKMVEIADIKAIAQDSIELIVKAKAGIKVNLNNFLTGIGQESLEARVQKLIIQNIALSASHKAILSSPDRLLVGLNSEIDEGCMYSLVSLEIMNVDVGRDVGAEMVAKSAQKDMALAQAEAERRKNDAIVATEQAKRETEEQKANVLSAEAEIPKALAQAIQEGRFSVMDYYKLMNLQADTAMRRSVSGQDMGDIE